MKKIIDNYNSKVYIGIWKHDSVNGKPNIFFRSYNDNSKFVKSDLNVITDKIKNAQSEYYFISNGDYID